VVKMNPDDQRQQETSDDLTAKSSASKTGENIAPTLAALIGMIAIGLLYAALPPKLIIGPNWLLLAVEAVFLVPLTFSLFTERGFSHRTKRNLVLVPLSITTLALILGIVLLIITLPTDKHATNLLRSAALLWGFNILVFALWYWELDGGGPWKRHLFGYQAIDFLFPQQANGATSWIPHFVDYLFLAFTAATALSPADTFPLTKAAKMLMMVEAILSLTIIVLLAARAVNMLGT
jgi:uncharacterized membrane protein